MYPESNESYEIHLGYRNRAPDFFAMYVEIYLIKGEVIDIF